MQSLGPQHLMENNFKVVLENDGQLLSVKSYETWIEELLVKHPENILGSALFSAMHKKCNLQIMNVNDIQLWLIKLLSINVDE